MEIVAINGSPRKKWNTATLLQNVLDGARETDPGIEATLVNLYDHKYQGCISCFACKLIGGPSYGKCVVKDDIQPVMQKVLHSDIAVFGSPVYFSDITGMMRCFLERLLFPNFVYDAAHTSIAPRKVRNAFLYTMNVPGKMMAQYHYKERLRPMESFVGNIFGHQPHVVYANDTTQFADYGKYMNSLFSPEEKKKVHETQFPLDCKAARELGAQLVREARMGE